MKQTLSLSLALLVLHGAAVSTLADSRVSERREGNAWVRTVMHEDGSRTVSKKDDTVKEIEKYTLSPDDVLLMRSSFQIDAEGKYLRGQVFDRAGNLIYVSEFVYDSQGRQIEERVVDAHGVPVRRLIFTYDQFGRARPFNISFANGAARAPVPVENADHFSSTNDHGFQLNPNEDGQAAAAPATAARPSEEDASSRAGLFKSTSKKRFRSFKKR